MKSMLAWLQRERGSTRLAFLLQTISRLATAGLALLWSRLLFQAMGEELNGYWLTFLGVASLGGLGDLGMGGAVGIRVSRMLGQKDEAGLVEFLASARTVFLLLSLVVAGLFAGLAPWLPERIGFQPFGSAGSFSLLFIFAALGFIPLIWNSYIANVNYACGNLLWPILPAFLFSQGALFAQWQLARNHAPLWMQQACYVVVGFLTLGLLWWFVRLSHPSLARLRPLRINWPEWRILAGQCFWMYLWGLGCFVYTTVDRLLITKGFGSAQVPRYHNNYKVCELALFAITAAGAMAMPKIARWLASRETVERQRGVSEILRLNRFQVALSCGAALTYLAVNDLFIRLWFAGVGDLRAELSWQYAFALSLVITGAGDAAMQVSPRCSERGLKVSGMAVGFTALLNVALSYAAMKAGSILGIALGTVVAQSFFSLWISRFVCQELELDWKSWAARTWLLPAAIVSAGYGARLVLNWSNPWQAGLLILIYAGLILLAAWGAGLTIGFVREEIRIVRGIFRGQR